MLDWLFRKDTQHVTEMADRIGTLVMDRVASKLTDEFVALAEVEQATEKVVELTKQIATLKIERDNIQEGFARKEREVEHKVGLLRQEMDVTEAQREAQYALRVQEAKLAAREAGLVEREKAFAERMDFIQGRFEKEVGYLKEMVGQIMKRLPDATVFGTKEL